MGPSNVPVSSRATDPKGAQQGLRREDHSHPGVPRVAFSPVVAGSPEPSATAPTSTPVLQRDSNTDGGSNEGLPGTSSGRVNFRQGLAVSCANFDLTNDEIDFLSNHVSSGTGTGYGYAWQRFADFCSANNVSPYTCPVNLLVRYLKKMYDQGAKYRTVNFARSAISKLHIGFGGVPAGQQPLIKKAVQAVFRLRPPLPKYETTFDVNKVLTYIQQILGNNDLLPLKLLSYKCLFLLSFYSISRVSSLQKLGADVKESQDHLIVPLMSLEKQARGEIQFKQLLNFNNISPASHPERLRGFIVFKKFPEDDRICPVKTLLSYLNKVRD